jgi:hypothetical protein
VTRSIGALSDRLVARLVPGARAEAGYWTSDCVCFDFNRYRHYCWQKPHDVECECRIYCYGCCI